MEADVERYVYIRHEDRLTLANVTKTLWESRNRFEDEDANYVPLRDDERTAIAPLTETGYELIGWGSSRIVLRMPSKSDLGEFVVKLGRYGTSLSSIGMHQNTEEVLLWADLNGTDWPLLPIFDWQETTARWVAMPYGTPVESDALDAERRIQLHSTAVEELSELDRLDDQELVAENFVIWNDRAWLADYGQNRPFPG